MKTILAMLVLTVSVGAIAQVEITKVLDKKEVSIDSDHAVIVRTSQTPDKVTLIMQVPMASSVCENWQNRYHPRTCFRTENQYENRQTNCRNVTRNIPGTPSTSTSPRGPRYNGTSGSSGTPSRTETVRVCDTVRVLVRSNSYPYDCSYNTNECIQWGTDVRRESDQVKIKFKDLPSLGGSEQETFRIAAKQRTKDGENVIYDISVISTVEGREYEVKSKGILGFDSYVIQSK